MSLHQRSRDSGICPPSLLTEERLLDEDGFEASMLTVVDAKGRIHVLFVSGWSCFRVSRYVLSLFNPLFFSGFFLQPEAEIAGDFRSVMKVSSDPHVE